MIPEYIQQLVGKSLGTTLFPVEKETIKRFADAVGETNQLYYNAEYAAATGQGVIIAPPGFISSPWYWGNTGDTDNIKGLGDVILALIDAGYLQTIDGGIDYEFFAPVKVGDTITVESRITNMSERGVDGEKAVFVFTETTYTNQDGTTVAISKVTTTHR